jgi:hypothetical protein
VAGRAWWLGVGGSMWLGRQGSAAWGQAGGVSPGPTLMGQDGFECMPTVTPGSYLPLLFQAQHVRDVRGWLTALCRHAKARAPAHVARAAERPAPSGAQIRSFRLGLQRSVSKQLAKHQRRNPDRPISQQLAVRMLHLVIFTLCCGDTIAPLRAVSARLLLVPGATRCENSACSMPEKCPGNQLRRLRSKAAGGASFSLCIVHYKVWKGTAAKAGGTHDALSAC